MSQEQMWHIQTESPSCCLRWFLNDKRNEKDKNMMLKSTLTVFGSFFVIVDGVNFDVIALIFSIFLLFIELIFDEFTDFEENSVDVDIVFGTGFYELNSVFFGKFLSILKSNLSIFFAAVALVTNNDFANAFGL
jgi:hypothetical protein